ncbi:hypothetical protein CCR91_10185, partial [Thiorhodovibrio winogradskyi]|nr:hypothetical protein [Thiorhodovibrio winogradskyi]
MEGEARDARRAVAIKDLRAHIRDAGHHLEIQPAVVRHVNIGHIAKVRSGFAKIAVCIQCLAGEMTTSGLERRFTHTRSMKMKGMHAARQAVKLCVKQYPIRSLGHGDFSDLAAVAILQLGFAQGGCGAGRKAE